MATNRKKKNKSGTKALSIILTMIVGIIVIAITVSARNNSEKKVIAAPTPSPITVTTPEPVEIVTVTPTPEPTPEPEPEYFTLSFIGDNTLWANVNFIYSEYGLPKVVGDNYAYPYQNTVQYFNDDEFTLANLECTLSDQNLQSSGETFSFRCPSAYVNILVEGGVDFVTMANNHTMDYYETGRDDTISALDSVGIKHGNENEYSIVETPNGIKLGIYTGYNTYHPEDNWDSITSALSDMKSQGADITIVMFHWGQELYYSPNENQVNLAHKCIDAGYDIVYGSHPHCLQPIEIYNDKLIMYSLGNWVFGGNTEPSDPDTAIIQATIKRDIDGTISYYDYSVIPCSLTTNIDAANAKANNTNYNLYASYNNYCPTIYPGDNEGYGRTMAKLDGSFVPDKEGADYSNYYASFS